MPTISRFLGIAIAMYFDDHGPPHFHARHTDGAARIRIDTLEPIDRSVVEHGVLRLTFADGMSAELSVLDRMRGPVFAEARTPMGFAEAAVDSESGTVVWPGGADLAPDTLYERARTGVWPDQHLAA